MASALTIHADVFVPSCPPSLCILPIVCRMRPSLLSSKPTTCLNPWLYFAYSNGLCEMTRVRFGGKGLDDQIFVLFCFVFNVVCVCTLGKACEEEFECFFMLNLRREKEYCFLCEQIISLCYCWTSQLLCYFMLRTNHLFENISDISLWMSVAGMMTKNIGAP